MVMSSNKSHSSEKLSFCGTVQTGLPWNLDASSCTTMRKTSSPHPWVDINHTAISGAALQIKLMVDFWGVKRFGFAGTESAIALQQDKKCTPHVHLSDKPVTVK